ncbi:hypothetical protein ABZP36_022890 [Zizania latifolia]
MESDCQFLLAPPLPTQLYYEPAVHEARFLQPLTVDELRAKLSERQDQSGSCDGEGDDKMNNASSCCLVEDDVSCLAEPVVGVSEDGSAAGGGYDDHLDYVGGGLPEPFCATPNLWESWPLVEWNAQ